MIIFNQSKTTVIKIAIILFIINWRYMLKIAVFMVENNDLLILRWGERHLN